MSEQRRCIVCAHAEVDAGEQTCVRCLSRARSHLIEVEQLYALLPRAIDDRAGAAGPVTGSLSRSSADRVVGGDAMVLYGPGSDGANQVRDMLTGRNEHGVHAADEYPGDVGSVLGELERWERDWRHTMGMPAAVDAATVTGCSLFLQRHVARMAQHTGSAFDEFCSDVRRLVGWLRAATCQGEAVDRGRRLGCSECGEPLVRRYRRPSRCGHAGPHCDHSHPDPARWPCRGSNTCGCDQGGRTDDWVCSSRPCGAVVDDASYWLRVKERYERAS